jgi:hypothetical protein
MDAYLMSFIQKYTRSLHSSLRQLTDVIDELKVEVDTPVHFTQPSSTSKKNNPISIPNVLVTSKITITNKSRFAISLRLQSPPVFAKQKTNGKDDVFRFLDGSFVLSFCRKKKIWCGKL